MGAHIVVDAFWGDSGKGLISAYLAYKTSADLIARAGTGTNAEHGIFLKDEKTYLNTHQLPLGFIFSKNPNIVIGSGVMVDPGLLYNEMYHYGLANSVHVDYRCGTILQSHIDTEMQNSRMKIIGSTMSGTGAARSDFIKRIAYQAKDTVSKRFLTDVGTQVNQKAREGTVIVESSQGTFLSLAVGDYPNVTSDNVLSTSAMDDVLLNPKLVEDIWLIVKALPTREGSGSMGSVEELSEHDIISGGFSEASSIAGNIRRKSAGIDFEMLKYACEINGANKIALTFVDHYDNDMVNVKSIDGITPKTADLISRIEATTGVPVCLLNTGKAYNNIIDLYGEVDWDDIDNNVNKYAGIGT
jgi:adenylosuccinate synthase